MTKRRPCFHEPLFVLIVGNVISKNTIFQSTVIKGRMKMSGGSSLCQMVGNMTSSDLKAAIEKAIDAVGRKEWGFVNTPMVSVNFLKGIFFGGKPKIYG